MTQHNNDRRFGGIARLYGECGFAQLQVSHICVIGLGGVGSWAVEALARSGIGAITLVDMDIVAESNINRQSLATTQSIGRDKTLVMQDRILSINPDCKVSVVDDFISRENLSRYLCENFDFVVDCIDDFRTKAALIHHCKKEKIKIITVGGAGGQIDPLRVRQTDLSKTEHDALLSKTRKLLRQDYGFARNPKRSFGIPSVFSDEQIAYPDGQGGITYTKSDAETENEESMSVLSCVGGIGSITHVTSTLALVAVAHVINTLAKTPSANKVPSVDKEPSADKEPLADKEPSADKEQKGSF